ncbi:MAG: DUF1902 domain-containing protein [Gammaproteobacteria bacterium]|nr:DUF1902 domain-containing protein [Gammaproteobacteria bacterium]
MFAIPNGTEPFIATCAKVAETSNLHALITTDAGIFYSTQLVKVTIGDGTEGRGMKITVTVVWDDEAKVWVATSNDVPGLVAETAAVEMLRNIVVTLNPELFELNGMAQPGAWPRRYSHNSVSYAPLLDDGVRYFQPTSSAARSINPASRESLQKAESPAAQGCAAIFNGRRPLKMKENKNHTFCFPYSEKSRRDLFRVSLAVIRSNRL